MSLFSQIISDYWRLPFEQGERLFHADGFSVTVNPELDQDRRVIVLETAEGQVMATLTPAMADWLGLYGASELSEAILRRLLRERGIALHGADYLFYFTEADKTALQRDAPSDNLRRLTEQDGDAFAAFQAAAPEQDLDDAYVELDHWAVYGAFDQGRIVCAASMYPWDDAAIADLGVLTLPAHRGQGLARQVVRAICRHAYQQGYQPQYRCQLDNHASRALAAAAGLSVFGKWEVVSPGCEA